MVKIDYAFNNGTGSELEISTRARERYLLIVTIPL